MVKKRGLGKSLDALLAYTNTNTALASAEDTKQNELTELPILSLERGKYQPRRDMNPESLNELANSIRQQGILQPLIVRPLPDSNRYEIIAGERRFRAAQIANLTTVPVVIREIPDEAALAIGLIENIQREDLSPIEEAVALDRLIEEFGMTHLEVAEAVGKSRATVTNLLRLLGLPDEVKKMLSNRQLEMGHARALVTLATSAQLEAAQLIVSRGMSVREAENLVRRIQQAQADGEAHQIKKSLTPDLLHLQDHLSEQFKAKVALHCNQKGKGKIVIHYKNLRELESIVSQIKVG